MKYLRLFQTVAERQAATLDYPNVNYTIENDSLEIIAEDPTPAFGGLTVKYNISDPTVEVTLFKGGGGSSTSSSTSGSGSGSGGGGVMPSKMYVDGSEETPINTWRFETAGEHIVQYEFAATAGGNVVVPSGFLHAIMTATEATIGDDITIIGGATADAYGAFQDSTITSATISDSVTDIEDNAFDNCLHLTTVTIGSGIEFIGDGAFADSNYSLASVTVNATTPPTLGGGAFNQSATNMVIYVPAASVQAYKEAPVWLEYALSIQPIS